MFAVPAVTLVPTFLISVFAIIVLGLLSSSRTVLRATVQARTFAQSCWP